MTNDMINDLVNLEGFNLRTYLCDADNRDDVDGDTFSLDDVRAIDAKVRVRKAEAEWLDQVKKNPLTANVSGRVLVSCGAIRKTGGLSKADFNRDGGVRQ
jgi:hypothetical protein